jgi:Relaxase/Mobilisation nuclease domain
MLFEELLEEIAGFAAKGFLVGNDDELLRKRRGSNLSWIATARDAEEFSGPSSKSRRASNSMVQNREVGGAAIPVAVLAKGDLDDAFRKLGSISYAGTGAKTRVADEVSGLSGGARTQVLLGGNAVFRADGTASDALGVFAKIAAYGVANDLEDEESRRRGGGGGGGSSDGVLTPQAVQQKRSTQQLAARAAIAAGAQPVVIKVISTVSAKASASALMEYLGTRENEEGERENIPVFNQFGESIEDAAGRAALVAEWTEGFKEPYSVSSCITVSLVLKGEVSDAALHEALNVVFGEKPFVYSRDGESVDVYGVSNLTAGKLNAQMKARASGEGVIAYLAKAEDEMASALQKSGVEASVTIKGATASEKSALYYLEKFMRAHPASIKANGDQIQAKGAAQVLSKQLYSDWQPYLKAVHPRNAFHVVFSGRAGTDAKAMVRAVSDFLGEQIPDHEWVIAHHAETGHVHVHAMITARDALGKPLRFTKPELFEWRENFAAKAREHGIAMVATRRADMAATRPFTQNQVGAYERAKIDPRYAIQPSTRVRVEAKREGRADLIAMMSGNLALAQRWERTATVLKLASPEAQFAYRAASGFVASVQAFRTDNVAGGKTTPNAAAPTQLPTKSIQNEIQEIMTMAISAPEARARIENINRNFDQAAGLVPAGRQSEFAAMRERVNSTLEARYAQLAAPVTPARQQVRNSIAKHGREYVVEGIGVMVEVQTAEKRLAQAKTEGKNQAAERQDHELALGKAAALAVQGNSYLREIAKSDATLARAIENAERENVAKSAAAKVAKTMTIEQADGAANRANPQDEARLKMINAPREVHPIALRQQAEKHAAEQREKALEEQKSKIAERAKAKGKDSDKGR